MIFRFSLYGLLKNQRYFEPFLILVFLEKGLTFFQIGLLVAFPRSGHQPLRDSFGCCR